MCDNNFKVCKKCNKTKHVSEFGVDNSQEDKSRTWCKECVNKAQRLRLSGSLKLPNHSNAELSGFTPRQLIDELKARGYTGELLYTQKIKL